MKSRVWGEYTGMLALLGGTLIASHIIPNRNRESLARPLSSVDSEIAGWKKAGLDELEPKLMAISYLSRTYKSKVSNWGC